MFDFRMCLALSVSFFPTLVCASMNTTARTHKRVSTLGRHHNGGSPATSWRACAPAEFAPTATINFADQGDSRSLLARRRLAETTVLPTYVRCRGDQELVEKPEIEFRRHEGFLLTETWSRTSVILIELSVARSFRTSVSQRRLSPWDYLPATTERTEVMICTSLLK